MRRKQKRIVGWAIARNWSTGDRGVVDGEDVFCAALQAGDQPAKEERCGKASGELRQHKPGNVPGADARKCIAEAARDADGGVGKGR